MANQLVEYSEIEDNFALLWFCELCNYLEQKKNGAAYLISLLPPQSS